MSWPPPTVDEAKINASRLAHASMQLGYAEGKLDQARELWYNALPPAPPDGVCIGFTDPRLTVPCEDPDWQVITKDYEQWCNATVEEHGWHARTNGWSDMTDGGFTFLFCMACETSYQLPTDDMVWD